MAKKPQSNAFNHTSNAKVGMGDYYGSGVKNPMGKIRSVTGYQKIAPSKLKTPPKKLG